MTLYSTVTPAAGTERLLVAHPGTSAVNYTRVDFSPFLPLKAKIDCMNFTCQLSDQSRASVAAIRKSIDGTLKIPKERRNFDGHGGPTLAVHDPSFRDLQFIVERFWDSRLRKIEFAVDARLPLGSNDMHLLQLLKAQLRHSLFPQRHERLPRAKRMCYQVSARRYKGEGLGTPMQQDGQIIWEQLAFSDKLALYIKEIDNKTLVSQPYVRMEARLYGSACSEADFDRIGMLPHFAADLRTYLAPMFYIASGFKNEAALTKMPGIPAKGPWSAWGAQWTGEGKARLNPDAEANRRLGDALNELRFSLMRLKPPSTVAHCYGEWIDINKYTPPLATYS